MDSDVFDSIAEKRLYRRLRSSWKKWIEIYPGLPVRRVLGYDKLISLPISEKRRDYLTRTDFDFVVCEADSTTPLLAVEFDGLGHGFSSDGQYVQKQAVHEDPYRSLKLEAKLEACTLAGFPLVIVSFEETEMLPDSDGMLTVLDAVIGEVLAAKLMGVHLASHSNEISDALAADPSGEMGEQLVWELEFLADVQANPIRRRIAEMQDRVGLCGESARFLRDRPGYSGARYAILGGFLTEDGRHLHQVLSEVSIYVRDVNCAGADTASILESVGMYCLYRKALREVGTDRAAWDRWMKTAPWTEE